MRQATSRVSNTKPENISTINISRKTSKLWMRLFMSFYRLQCIHSFSELYQNIIDEKRVQIRCKLIEKSREQNLLQEAFLLAKLLKMIDYSPSYIHRTVNLIYRQNFHQSLPKYTQLQINSLADKVNEIYDRDLE